MGSTAGGQSGVKSALRTLDLLEYVVAQPAGVVAQDIAAALAIPVSSLSYLLATLVERGYLRREGRRHFPGEGLDRLRRPLSEHSLEDRARPLLRALVQQLNETASLFVPVEQEMETRLTEVSSQALRYAIEPGTRTPFHCVAAGKAMLAAMEPDALETLLAALPLDRFTPSTITDKAALRAQLAQIRETGLGFTQDEYTMGISGVGVAVRQGGRLVAGLGVACPNTRFTPDMRSRIIDHLQRAAAALGAA